jgi:hypothetical protein
MLRQPASTAGAGPNSAHDHHQDRQAAGHAHRVRLERQQVGHDHQHHEREHVDERFPLAGRGARRREQQRDDGHGDIDRNPPCVRAPKGVADAHGR